MVSHDKYKKNLTVAELRDLHYTYNPALTTAQKNNLNIIFEDLENDRTVYSEEIAGDILAACLLREQARQAAQACIEIINGKAEDFTEVCKALEDIEQPVVESDLIPVSDELEDILAGVKENIKWEYNIPELRNAAGGGGPGVFLIVAARPEMGKTAFWVSLTCAPNGFCAQGAKVHGIINEEQAVRTKARGISSCIGKTISEIEVSFEDYKEEIAAKLKGRFQVFDAVGATFEALDAHIKKYRPDILVIDQLDKVKVDGDFNSSHERLREVYTRARELAKTNSVFIIGISQLSADAEGKQTVDYSMLEGSKTGKAAEADVIICIGANPAFKDWTRQLNLTKNKITGNHSAVNCTLNQALSRYGV